MPMTLFFVSRSTGKKYRVLAMDKTQTPPVLTLQGEHAQFVQSFDKELFQRCGYDLVKETTPDEEPSHA